MDEMLKAEEAFNAILAQAKNHNHLALLARDGWEELFPDPDFWTFRHPNHPGFIIRWFHGTKSGRAIQTFCN